MEILLVDIGKLILFKQLEYKVRGDIDDLMIITDPDEEFVDARETDWYRKAKAGQTPASKRACMIQIVSAWA